MAETEWPKTEFELWYLSRVPAFLERDAYYHAVLADQLRKDGKGEYCDDDTKELFEAFMAGAKCTTARY